MRQSKQPTEELVPSGWCGTPFRISTADGWLDVDGMVRLPFGTDQRSIDQAGNRGWSVTHPPSGLAVVTQASALVVAVASVDRIPGLTDWTAQSISATTELGTGSG